MLEKLGVIATTLGDIVDNPDLARLLPEDNRLEEAFECISETYAAIENADEVPC